MFMSTYKLIGSFYSLCVFTKGRQVVKKGQNFVYVNIECPIMARNQTEFKHLMCSIQLNLKLSSKTKTRLEYLLG